MPVFDPVASLWADLASSAAQETIKAVKKSAGIELTLRDVPMDTFQLFVGRQHQLGMEVEGTTYELVLGNEQELVAQARARKPKEALPEAAAKGGDASGLVPQQSWSASQLAAGGGPSGSASAASQEEEPAPALGGVVALPEAALAGPLELVLPGGRAEAVNVFSPLAADVGLARRVVVGAGTTVYVSGVKRVALRRPVELPRLPGQYLAEVYAHVQLGEPEEGFDFAPGILYMAQQLRARALNASSASEPPLLSLEVEPVAPGALTLRSAPELAGEGLAPRLKVRKLKGGTVELTLRQGQLSAVGLDGPGAFNLAALSHVWAFPMPHAAMSAWLPYEALLRSVLAAHPFDAAKVARSGVGLRLTKSSIQGVHLVAFDMEVRGKAQRPAELEGSDMEFNETPLEVWEAVVQVQPAADATEGDGAGAPALTFVPLHVKRKASYQNTLTLSRGAVLAALAGAAAQDQEGGGDGRNVTALLPPPHGYEEDAL